MKLRVALAVAAAVSVLAWSPVRTAQADEHHGWGDYDHHHDWHSADWWHAHYPGWVWEHHPEWAERSRKRPRPRTDLAPNSSGVSGGCASDRRRVGGGHRWINSRF